MRSRYCHRWLGNSGTIENLGSGAAIGGAQSAYVNNGATGRITSADGTAIRGDTVYLTNEGVIIGSIDAPGTSGGQSWIDGGAGLDTLRLGVESDALLNGAPLASNFERVQFTLAGTSTLTFGEDFASTASTTVNGGLDNLVVNNGDFSVQLNSGDPYALSVRAKGFTNTGSITAGIGNGVQIYSYGSGAGFTNSGDITAAGVGAFVTSAMNNSGTIRSTGSIGVSLFSNGQGDSINDGRIEGATTGLNFSAGQLVNNGVIAGGQTGVLFSYGGTIENAQGGTISGGTNAILANATYSSTQIRNAGTINGNITLSSAYNNIGSPGDIFVDRGGTVNGNVNLGGGDDYFVTDLGRAGGVTGTIDGGTGLDTLFHRVTADATVALVRPAGFEVLGYALAKDAGLTLSGQGAQDLALAFSGTGTVDLSADLRVTDGTVLNLAAPSLAELENADVDPDAPHFLDVISRGALTLTLTLTANGYAYNSTAAVAVGTNRFENAGTITVTAAPNGFRPIAILNGGEAVNSGTISLDGTLGISQNFGSFTNSGSILQAGSLRSTGFEGGGTLVNSGTIRTDGAAISTTYFPLAITNSGLIESRSLPAIYAPQNNYVSVRIDNQASGIIRGNGNAIQLGGGAIFNAGQIIGNVALGGSYYLDSLYVADGGTIQGNLRFGNGNDIFLQRGDIRNADTNDAVVSLSLYDSHALAATNSGTITGGLSAELTFAPGESPATGSIVNSGTITASGADRAGVELIGWARDPPLVRRAA